VYIFSHLNPLFLDLLILRLFQFAIAMLFSSNWGKGQEPLTNIILDWGRTQSLNPLTNQQITNRLGDSNPKSNKKSTIAITT
jgi:hypothetical protein